METGTTQVPSDQQSGLRRANRIIQTLALYIGLTEQELTTGGPRTGIIHPVTGNNAVFPGFGFLAIGLAALAYLLRFKKYCFIYWLLLTVFWTGGFFYYCLAHF